MKRNVINIDKRQGDILTVSDIDATGLSIYHHINALIPDDIKAVTTKQFEKEDTGFSIPNYCGMMSARDTAYNMYMGDSRFGLVDSIIEKLIREIDNTLEEI